MKGIYILYYVTEYPKSETTVTITKSLTSKDGHSLSLPLFPFIRGEVRAACNFFTASSAILLHPPLYPVLFFQSPSSPVFFTSLLKRGCIEFKYYVDGIHSDLTPPGNNS